MRSINLLPLLDLLTDHDASVDDVVEGLQAAQPRLPSKYFYDQAGSQLFDAICELPEYYLTRTELSIMRASLDEIATCVGGGATVIEMGSGSGLKTELLLGALDRPVAYVPVDISRDHLLASAERLADRYPDIEIGPVCADFLRPMHVPGALAAAGRRIVYFPGSTIGNLDTAQSDTLLRRFSDLVLRDGGVAPGGLLIGVDLQKDVVVLERAYNDSAGLTARFNLNILHHINRLLRCDIPVDAFAHRAPYVREFDRIEMHLVAQRPVDFSVKGRPIAIAAGGRILTEYSHKYSLVKLEGQLARSGWEINAIWTDPRRYFALLYCETTHPI